MTAQTAYPQHDVNPANLDGCIFCGHEITGRTSRITQLGDALVDVCRDRGACDSRAYLTPMTKAAKYVRVCLTVVKGDGDKVAQILTGAYPKSYAKAQELATAQGLDVNEATSKVWTEYQGMALALALITGENRHRTIL